MTAFTSVKIEERKKAQIKPGNTVKVWQKIIDEKGKTRLQAFEGLVIAHKHGTEPGATFTVRKTFQGIGVERIFPLFSPNIEKIDLVKVSKVRKSKLYYIRDKTSKEIRKKMKTLKQEGKKKVVAKPVKEAEAEVVAEEVKDNA